MSQELPRTAFHSLAKALTGGLERMLGKKPQDGELEAQDESSESAEEDAAAVLEGDTDFVEFTALQASLGAEDQGSSLERTAILQGAELAELRRNLGLLRPIGERIAELEEELEQERVAHAADVAELRRELAKREKEPSQLRLELERMAEGLHTTRALARDVEARGKEHVKRLLERVAREKQLTAEARKQLAAARTAATAAEEEAQRLHQELDLVRQELGRLATEHAARERLLEELRGPVEKLVATGPKQTARDAKQRLVELMRLEPPAPTPAPAPAPAKARPRAKAKPEPAAKRPARKKPAKKSGRR